MGLLAPIPAKVLKELNIIQIINKKSLNCSEFVHRAFSDYEQLANVKDVNYRTEETPSESENVNNNHAYEYDEVSVVPTRCFW